MNVECTKLEEEKVFVIFIQEMSGELIRGQEDLGYKDTAGTRMPFPRSKLTIFMMHYYSLKKLIIFLGKCNIAKSDTSVTREWLPLVKTPISAFCGASTVRFFSATKLCCCFFRHSNVYDHDFSCEVGPHSAYTSIQTTSQ